MKKSCRKDKQWRRQSAACLGFTARLDVLKAVLGRSSRVESRSDRFRLCSFPTFALLAAELASLHTESEFSEVSGLMIVK